MIRKSDTLDDEEMLEFYKYEAAGNDFILVDLISETEREQIYFDFLKKSAPKLCERHFGVGADGILVLTRSDRAYAFMHVINADGSIASMCGNGIRCVARYLYRKRVFRTDLPLEIDTLGGIQTVRFISKTEDAYLIDVLMARAQLAGDVQIVHDSEVFRGIKVDVGNPHAVFEVCDPKTSLEESGAFLSNHSSFVDRSNIEFIREISKNNIELCVYERGVGPTLSCGTGCVAAAVAYCEKRSLKSEDIAINTAGGLLHVIYSAQEIHLQGPSRFVFCGKFEE